MTSEMVLLKKMQYYFKSVTCYNITKCETLKV